MREIYRRDVLKGSLAAALAPSFPKLAAAKSKRRFIDVHCHFFNAADLPIRGFLQRVVLADYAATDSTQHAGASLSLTIWKGMVAKLTELILRRQTPTAQQELACLRGASCQGFEVSAKSLSSSKRAKVNAGDLRGGISDVLQEHYRARQEKSLPSPEAAKNAADVDDFVDFVLREMKAKGAAAPGASSKSMKSLNLRSTADSIAEFIASGRSFFSRYFAWAATLTDYRENIVKTYFSLYAKDNSRLILATPALVDYNYWLEDQSPSALRDQVELMGQLSLKQPSPMHGFVAFDPLRAVRHKPEEEAPLDIVKDAVAKHGFLGVKLYSPMGFKPTDNAEHGLVFPAHAALSEPGFGAKLDHALDELYSWCHDNEVPILAHSTQSQSAGPEFAARAEPKFWGKVLSAYPKLRLNLAHFGNFSQALATKGDATKQFDKTWEHEVAVLIKGGKFPNVYADVSYFYWVLEGSGNKQDIKAVKKLFAKYFEADPKVERLLFGTDWNMTGKAAGVADYFDNVEAFFRDIGLKEKQLDNLFHKNALRFLGLDGDTAAGGRLRNFYQAAGKSYPHFV